MKKVPFVKTKGTRKSLRKVFVTKNMILAEAVVSGTAGAVTEL